MPDNYDDYEEWLADSGQEDTANAREWFNAETPEERSEFMENHPGYFVPDEDTGEYSDP